MGTDLGNFISRKWLIIVKHLAIIGSIFLVITLGFFYIHLPMVTNHGESITVPDLEGMPMEELDNFLVKRRLRYEVSDSSYSARYDPLTVLSQFPEPGAKVKENRKIYLTVNSFIPPSTRMPDLIDRSLRNAELELSSHELVRGRILLKPSPFENAVLEQRFEGEEIEPGTKVPKGSVIDLVVGDGFGRRNFQLPNFVGLPVDEAMLSIVGMDLRVGRMINEGDTPDIVGFIYDQSPDEGSLVRVGDAIDLWIVPTDSLLQIRMSPDTTGIQ